MYHQHHTAAAHNAEHPRVYELVRKGDVSAATALKLINGGTGPVKQKDGHPHQLEKCLSELDALVGLDEIKELIRETCALVQVRRKRQAYGLKVESPVLHMIFSGNPGTGKTTVARILGKLFHALGLLDEGHTVEVERADLVGEYIGHTARKTLDAVEKAAGGILFIDEAYALARGGEKDFGRESIDTVVKAMEDRKDSFVLILAGYPREIETFLYSNPGLHSRFPIQLDFPDYTLNELCRIAAQIAEKREYVLTREAGMKLKKILKRLQLRGELRRGNGRLVRNLIERAIRRQAVRLTNRTEPKRRDLLELKPSDFEGASHRG